MISSLLEYERIQTRGVMCVIGLVMAVFWAVVLEMMKKKIIDTLPSRVWWSRTVAPLNSMMVNFGFPKEPTVEFPNGITDLMSRDSFAFQVTICVQHIISALVMVPVLMRGWEGSSDLYKSMFLLGTLSDLGFDIYDATQTTFRAFVPNHPNALPVKFFIVVVLLHHSMAFSLLVPMNLYYLHRFEYHQTAVSLLMAAALCTFAGLWKFTLDITKNRIDFFLYKCTVLFQLGVILYTRVYLWFAATSSFRSHLKDQHDMAFWYAACIVTTIFSLFNVLLVVDGLTAALKCIPKKFGETEKEREEAAVAIRRASAAIDASGGVIFTRFQAKRKFKGVVKGVIANNRFQSSISRDSKSD